MKDPEYSIGLFLHIIGIIMIAGGFLGAYGRTTIFGNRVILIFSKPARFYHS